MIESEIPPPKPADFSATALDVQMGAPVPVLDRLLIMSSDDWEDFTLELVHHLKEQYRKVTKCGGGGDMGRDVIAYTASGWNNYQCKHYKEKLSVEDAVLEIGKICYYTYIGEYPLPERYYFVTPKGCGTNLIKALHDPQKLKSELLSRWDKTCASKITKSKIIELDSEFLAHIDTIDFSIFDDIPPLALIELHSKTPFHTLRFGLYNRRRPEIPKAPEAIAASEHIYTAALLEAFSDKKGEVIDLSSIANHPDFKIELKSARNNFYAAESLERFSRDWLPSGYFSDLKEECHEAISATVNQQYTDGYACYLKTCEISALAQYSSHPLHPFIKIQDKKGLCHHIVNDQVFRWVKK